MQPLRQWLDRNETVQEVFYVTGNWDIVVVMVVQDMQTHETTISALLGENPNIRKLTTSVCLQVFKRTFALPIHSAS